MEFEIKLPSVTKFILIAVLFLTLGLVGGYFYKAKTSPAPEQVAEKRAENIRIAFLMEVYDKVKENYWEKISDEALVKTFVLGIERLSGQPQNLKKQDRENLEKALVQIDNQIDSQEKQKEFVSKLADIVLANLEPFGRSRLYIQKDEIALKNNVQNKTEVDHYKVLGVEKDAPQEEIEKAYQKKEAELKDDTTEEGQKKYQEVVQAGKVIADTGAKKLYDQAGIEPTMDYTLVQPEILHLHIKKFSPTTLEELERVTKKVDQGDKLDTLILDLRDNIGGAIDGLPYFLGPFIGNDQYAYQFYHQGEKEDYKTKLGWLPSLVRYKKVVVLINENAQSSAEVMASVLKKYNVGVLVGRTTKGWGTVERVFKLDNQIDELEEYSMFLVHRVTLREDSQLIEGRGVDPAIDIDAPNWKSELLDRFNSPELVEAVDQIWQKT